MDRYEYIAAVRMDGKNSKKIAVTKPCKALGLEPGDYVRVILERV